MFSIGDAINRARYESEGGANAAFWNELENALKEALRMGFKSTEEMEAWWNGQAWNRMRPEQMASTKPKVRVPGRRFTVGGIVEGLPEGAKIEESMLGQVTEPEQPVDQVGGFERELPTLDELSGSLNMSEQQELRSRVSARASLGLNAKGKVGVNGLGGLELSGGIGERVSPKTRSTTTTRDKVY